MEREGHAVLLERGARKLAKAALFGAFVCIFFGVLAHGLQVMRGGEATNSGVNELVVAASSGFVFFLVIYCVIVLAIGLVKSPADSRKD